MASQGDAEGVTPRVFASGLGLTNCRVIVFGLAASKGIYLEILIQGEMAKLWGKNSRAEGAPQRGDLRFSEIDYLPRKNGEAQKFLYQTRIGAAMRIRGTGESRGRTW